MKNRIDCCIRSIWIAISGKSGQRAGTPENAQCATMPPETSPTNAVNKSPNTDANVEVLPDDIGPVVVSLPGAAYRLRYDRVVNIIYTQNKD